MVSLSLCLGRDVLEPESARGALRGVGPHGEVELAVQRLVEALQIVAATPARTIFLVLRKGILTNRQICLLKNHLLTNFSP